MSTTVETAAAIGPFHVDVPEERIDDLRRRISATRWPDKELVADRSQGVQLAVTQELARYWLDNYDFGRVEARLNALPQFTTEIDGVNVHFIHVRSPHEEALPLIMTHGWPGSVIEQIDTVGPLTDPTAHGGSAEDAFHLVLPSLPGYGFSSQPAELGWNLSRVARAWAELMKRLGYTRYVAQGGDVGAGVTDAMGRLAPEGLIGIHTNLLVPALNDPAALPADSERERAALAAIKTFQTSTPPGPARRRRRTFGSRSPSRRSPARSGGRLAAGSRSRMRTSSTSARSTRAGTSPPGRSRSFSPRNYAARSRRFAECPSPTTYGGPHDCHQHAS